MGRTKKASERMLAISAEKRELREQIANVHRHASAAKLEEEKLVEERRQE